jgi:hypothetical protein
MAFYSTSAGPTACVYRTTTDITTISGVRSVDELPIVVKNSQWQGQNGGGMFPLPYDSTEPGKSRQMAVLIAYYRER